MPAYESQKQSTEIIRKNCYFTKCITYKCTKPIMQHWSLFTAILDLSYYNQATYFEYVSYTNDIKEEL